MRALPPNPTIGRRRRRGAGLVALAVGAVLAAVGASGAATTPLTVSMSVPSATTIDPAGCESHMADITDFGTVLPTDQRVTGADCVVGFGSSTSSSMLRMYQQDGLGTALASNRNTWTSTGAGSPGIHAVASVAGGVGYAAIDATIIRTTDSGATWVAETSGVVNDWLNDIAIVDANTAWAVGSGGTIIKRTLGGGSTWTSQVSGTTAMLYGVTAIDANTAYAVGEGCTVLRTTNGGATWAPVTLGFACGEALLSVRASGPGNVIAVGGPGRIIRWNGTAWSSPAAPQPYWMMDVAFVPGTPSTVVATGEGGVIWRSTTSGATWAAVAYTPAQQYYRFLYALTGIPGTNTLVVAGEMGETLRSTDGGATWSPLTTGNVNSIEALASWTGGTVVAVGNGLAHVRSTNSGTSWTLVVAGAGPRQTVLANSVPTVGTIYEAGGFGTIRMSTDGGMTWTSQASGVPITEALWGIDVRASGAGLAVGDGGVIRRTTNGGTTWSASPSGVTARLRSVTMANDLVAWAVGDNSTVLKTTDGGVSWALVNSGGVDLSSVSAASTTHVWIGATTGVTRSVDGGATWNTPTATGFGAASDVAAVSATVAWVLHSDGAVSVTGDNGVTWSTNSIYERAFSIAAPTHKVAYVSTRFGKVYGTKDGGLTWDLARSGGLNLTVAAFDANTAYASGGGGDTIRAVGSTPIADYAPGSNWATGSSTFGACLRAVSGGASTDASTWTANATCPASDGAWWRPVPATSGLAGAKVAAAAGNPSTGAVARLRFGVKIAATQPSGYYTAPIVFEVVAPNA